MGFGDRDRPPPEVLEEMDRVFGKIEDDTKPIWETPATGEKPRHRPPLGDNMVLLPKHYSRFQIEPARFSVENKLDGLEFNIVKYICRAPYKHSDRGKQDYGKAIRSTIMKAKYEQGDPDWWKPYRNPELGRLIEEEMTYNAVDPR